MARRPFPGRRVDIESESESEADDHDHGHDMAGTRSSPPPPARTSRPPKPAMTMPAVEPATVTQEGEESATGFTRSLEDAVASALSAPQHPSQGGGF
jgi:hypothetical protein